MWKRSEVEPMNLFEWFQFVAKQHDKYRKNRHQLWVVSKSTYVFHLLSCRLLGGIRTHRPSTTPINLNIFLTNKSELSETEVKAKETLCQLYDNPLVPLTIGELQIHNVDYDLQMSLYGEHAFVSHPVLGEFRTTNSYLVRKVESEIQMLQASFL